MLASVIAARYAKALLESAKEEGVEDRVAGEAAVLAEALGEDADVKRFLAAPLSSATAKLEVLLSALPEPPHTLLKQFLKAVLENRRERHLGAMLKKFLELLREIRGEVSAKLSTAFKLEARQREMLESELSRRLDRKVQLIPVVDRQLIAGASLRIGDTVYDGSLKSSLERLEKELKDETVKKPGLKRPGGPEDPQEK